MTENVPAHDTSVTMVNSAPAALDASTGMQLKVRVACASGCDLRGMPVYIIAQESLVATSELVSFNDGMNETDEFVVEGPAEPGEYAWTAKFVEKEREVTCHAPSSTSFSFVVRPHTTTMAVWDVPSPIPYGESFAIKVGLNCSAKCMLEDQEIEICDQAGVRMGVGKLGGTPWLETSSLYWAEIALRAPDTAGLNTWTVKFSDPDLPLAHEGSTHNFSFVAAAPPAHMVTVEAIDRDTKMPIKDATVLLDLYRAFTDRYGMATLKVPKGSYELVVSRHCYERLETMVDVGDDLDVKADLLYDPLQLDTA